MGKANNGIGNKESGLFSRLNLSTRCMEGLRGLQGTSAESAGFFWEEVKRKGGLFQVGDEKVAEKARVVSSQCCLETELMMRGLQAAHCFRLPKGGRFCEDSGFLRETKRLLGANKKIEKDGIVKGVAQFSGLKEGLSLPIELPFPHIALEFEVNAEDVFEYCANQGMIPATVNPKSFSIIRVLVLVSYGKMQFGEQDACPSLQMQVFSDITPRYLNARLIGDRDKLRDAFAATAVGRNEQEKDRALRNWAKPYIGVDMLPLSPCMDVIIVPKDMEEDELHKLNDAEFVKENGYGMLWKEEVSALGMSFVPGMQSWHRAAVSEAPLGLRDRVNGETQLLEFMGMLAYSSSSLEEVMSCAEEMKMRVSPKHTLEDHVFFYSRACDYQTASKYCVNSFSRVVFSISDYVQTVEDIVFEEAHNSVVGDLCEKSLLSVLDFLSVYACQNIIHETVPLTDSEKKINKKRAKKKKAELYEYHLLKVNLKDKVKKVPVEKKGTHASPRTHWRRGHRRVYSDGHSIFISPMLVNPGHGYVDKGYLV